MGEAGTRPFSSTGSCSCNVVLSLNSFLVISTEKSIQVIVKMGEWI